MYKSRKSFYFDSVSVLTFGQATPIADENISIIDPEYQTETFRKFLCSLYNRHYTLRSEKEVEIIIAIADFYWALPQLSATLTGALLGSPIFSSAEYFALMAAGPLLFLAKKLRHAVLYRECLVYLVACWQDCDTNIFGIGLVKQDTALNNLCAKAYGQLCSKILNVNQELLHSVLHDNSLSPRIEEAFIRSCNFRSNSNV